MGGKQSFPKMVNFEEVQQSLTSKSYLLINTLPLTSQTCLIQSTLDASLEAITINDMVAASHESPLKRTKIIIYGTNTLDTSVFAKQHQLISFGFEETYVYPGGLFEWLLLQDIYGDSLFPTTIPELDILRFK